MIIPRLLLVLNSYNNWRILFALKKCMVLSTLSGFGPRLVPIWLMFNSSLSVPYILHSTKMCLIVVVVAHVWHIGGFCNN